LFHGCNKTPPLGLGGGAVSYRRIAPASRGSAPLGRQVLRWILLGLMAGAGAGGAPSRTARGRRRGASRRAQARRSGPGRRRRPARHGGCRGRERRWPSRRPPDRPADRAAVRGRLRAAEPRAGTPPAGRGRRRRRRTARSPRAARGSRTGRPPGSGNRPPQRRGARLRSQRWRGSWPRRLPWRKPTIGGSFTSPGLSA
jgi:hypothetical protein